ncbi:hypothetical protein L1887_55735 [Cichorium endivia]|nr:hypothetical protein L1887_55735 [Cichorium endivia]
MAESSRSAQWTNGQQAIVVIDDDDVAMPSASTYAAGRQAHSPAGSLTNLTPAMSVTTSSNSSDDRDLVGMTNGIGLGAREEASGALDKFRAEAREPQLAVHQRAFGLRCPAFVRRRHRAVRCDCVGPHPQRLRHRPPTGTPCRAGQEHGLLLLQQRRRSHALPAAKVPADHTQDPHPRLGRPPRQRHAARVRKRRRSALRLAPPLRGRRLLPGLQVRQLRQRRYGTGRGQIRQRAWPTKGMGDADYMYAFHHLVMPIALEFAPDFVIISAGFDAAEGDPIGESRVTPGGYAQMTHALTSLCDGKVAVVLEGGYNPDAVADSAHAVTEVILARRTVEPKETVASTIAANTVREVCRFHQRYWKSLKVPDLEADDVDFDTHDAPPSVRIEDLLSEYRNSVLSDRFDLFEVPLPEADVHFSGQVLCSEGILERLRRWCSLCTIWAICVRDGLDWAYGLVDMNIMREFRAVKPHAHDAMPRAALSDDTDHIAEANEAAAFVWDNIVSLARASTATKIVMIGFGTGCDVLTSLIQARDVETQVKAVVNIVGYNEMPRIDPTAELAKKKWYYTKSKVLAPADHRHILERGDSVPLKRSEKSPQSVSQPHPKSHSCKTKILIPSPSSPPHVLMTRRRGSHQHPQPPLWRNHKLHRKEAQPATQTSRVTSSQSIPSPSPHWAHSPSSLCEEKRMWRLRGKHEEQQGVRRRC